MQPALPDLQQPTRIVARSIADWVRAFLRAKLAEGVAPTTIERVYTPVLRAFAAYCADRGVVDLGAVDPEIIRERLIDVAAGHAPSTVHRHYRTIKTLLLWYESEAAPDGWRNPIRRVRAPKVPERIMDPASLDVIALYVRRAPTRDRAILLTLIDTGLRASELLSLRTSDYDPLDSTLTVRHGKGGKVRVAPIGARCRRAIRAWLRERPRDDAYLFCARDGGRLTYWGLRDAMLRIEKRTGIKAPTMHSIRRAFALAMIRSGVDLLSVARLLGHADLSQVPKYLKQVAADLRAAHAQASPADRL